MPELGAGVTGDAWAPLNRLTRERDRQQLAPAGAGPKPDPLSAHDGD